MSSVARRYYDRGRQALDTGDLETAQQQLASALQLAPNFGSATCAYAGECSERMQAMTASGWAYRISM